MKKLFCAVLAVCLLCGALTAGVSAAEDDYTGKTVILVTGNLRGQVAFYPQIAAAKQDYEAKGAEVILADAGNYLQGSAAANTDMGRSIYDLMDAAGYDVAGMGLAEFSYGPATTGMPYHNNQTRYYTQKELQNGAAELTYRQGSSDSAATLTRAAKEPAKFKTVASNVTANADYYSFETSVTVETKAGLKVSFYGLADPGVKEQVQDGWIEAVSPAAPAVSGDVVVLLSGMEAFPALDSPEGAGWAELPRDAVMVDLSGGGATVAAYVVDNETKTVTPETPRMSASDETVAALAEAVKANASPVAGTSSVVLNGADSVNWKQETNLGDLVADALLWYAENYIDGYDKTLPIVAIQNGGNVDQFLYSGDITEVDLLRALPFSPMGIGVLEVTGAELLEALEAGTSPSARYGDELCPGFAQVAGLKYTIDPSEDYDGGAAYGNFYEADSVNRVSIAEVGGKAFDPAAKYAVVADNYVLNGNDTYYVFKNAKDAGAAYVNNGTGVRTRDAVALYIEKVLGGAIGETYAKAQGRVTVLDAPAFDDVKRGEYYYEAVDWAVANGITEGTSDTTFSPAAVCTRAQVATFLYRLAGSPPYDLSAPHFVDVAADSVYAPAIAWAEQRGITDGVDETHFNPDAPITRAEAVTFVYRYAQSKGEGFTGAWMFLLDYPDRADVPDWAYEPLCWTTMNKVIESVDGGLLAPNAACPRGQIVTILYRYAQL